MFFQSENSAFSSKKANNAFDVVLYLVDYDGCLSHGGVFKSDCKNIVLNNKGLLETLKSKHKLNPQGVMLIGSGSARQSLGQDIANAKRNRTGSCYIDIQQVADELGIDVATMTLPDVFNDLPKGESWSRALDPNNQEPHPAFIPDSSKLTLLHMHIHSIAEAYPNKRICVEIIDDKWLILSGLERAYKRYSQMLPSNVTVYTSQYEGGNLQSSSPIRGTGELDVHYRQTVIDMIAITTNRVQGSSRDCTTLVTPDSLSKYRSEFIEQMPENNEINHLKVQEKHTCLYTYKSNQIIAELSDWCANDNETINSTLVGFWTAKNAEMRSKEFQERFIECIKSNFFYGMQRLGYFDEALLYTASTVTTSRSKLGWTLLHQAVYRYSGIALEYLLEKHIKNNIPIHRVTPEEPGKFFSNQSALGIAIEGGLLALEKSGRSKQEKHEITQQFIKLAYTFFKNGALPPHQARENHLIHLLAKNNKYDELKEVLKADPSLRNLQDKQGHTIDVYANKTDYCWWSSWLIAEVQEVASSELRASP